MVSKQFNFANLENKDSFFIYDEAKCKNISLVRFFSNIKSY